MTFHAKEERRRARPDFRFARKARLGSAGELGKQHAGPGTPHVPSVRC
jgi:hypothetical protein